MRPRRLLLNLGLAAAILLAAEGWASLGDRPPKYRLSESLGYELAPGFRGKHESVNLAGLRGAEIGPKRPGVLRILAMGGSTTWGHKVDDDETWPVALERELRAATGGEVEVLNGGVSGWDLEAVVIALRQRYLEELQPDLVLVNVGWNLPLVADNAPVAKIRRDVLAASRRDGPYRSAFVRWLAATLEEWQAEAGGSEPLQAAHELAALRARCYPALFEELKRECDAHGARVVALLYPCLVQRPPPAGGAALAAYEEPLRRNLGGEKDVPALVEIAQTQYQGGLQAVVDAAGAAGVEQLDLAGRLLADLPIDGADVVWAGYFRDHAHFSPAGDAAIGRSLARLLVEERLVAAGP